MTVKNRVFYFQRLSNVEVYADTLRAAGIDLTRLEYEMARTEIDRVMAVAQGYQLQANSRIAVEQGYAGDRALIERCPDLLAVSMPGSGYDAANIADCTEAGVLAVNQAGLHANAVAQHALAMMICLSKKIVEAHTLLHGADPWARLDLAGRDIDGKTLGIAGFGAVGRRLAGICGGAFGMRVLTHHPRMADGEVRAHGAEPAAFETVLREADFLVAALPLTDATRGLFDAGAFAMMKPSAYLITVARGGVHDEAALARALEAGEIAGAGLDVWDVEPPPPDHPLLAFPNVLATPHIAGMTVDSWDKVSRGAALQWIDIFEGRRPPRLLNPEVWPRYAARYARVIGRPVEKHPDV